MSIGLTDTHCHLTNKQLAADTPSHIAQAQQAGVSRMITIATSLEDSIAAQQVASVHPSVYFTAGIHPLYAAEALDAPRVSDVLRQMWQDSNCVGFGEMGLDCHYHEPPIAWQEAAFEAQLRVAADMPEVPLVLHSRRAVFPTIDKLNAYGIAGERCVFHCFTEGIAEAEAVLAFGACIGFTGVVTFASAPEVAAASDIVPLERLLIETDSPYLTPAPHRKIRLNAPKYVAAIASFLAERRGLSAQDFATQTTANAKALFTRLI